MKKIMLNKKGVSYLITIYVMLLLATLAYVGSSLFVVDTHITEDKRISTQALFLAEAGIHCALEEQLDGDANWADVSDFSRDIGPGDFSVHFVDAATSTVTIESTATIGEVSRKIMQKFTRQDAGVPDAFKYIIHAGGNININDATGGVLNGDVSSGEGTIHIGDITFNGDAYPASGVPVPTVDFNGYYGDAPAGQRMTSDFTFESGNTYDGVWYIDGSATVETGATINGTIVATGNIDLKNSVGVTIDPPVPYPAMISGGNIITNNMSKSYVRGLVFAAGAINNAVMNEMSEAQFFGTIIGCISVNMNNANSINATYDPDIMINPPPHFIGDDEKIKPTEWKEIY